MSKALPRPGTDRQARAPRAAISRDVRRGRPGRDLVAPGAPASGTRDRRGSEWRRPPLSRGVRRIGHPGGRVSRDAAAALRQSVGGGRRTPVGGPILGAHSREAARWSVPSARRANGAARLAEAKAELRDLEPREPLDAGTCVEHVARAAHRHGPLEWGGRGGRPKALGATTEVIDSKAICGLALMP
jgi:hypothetical protein